MASSMHLRQRFILIGNTTSQITGKKLPSNLQLLKAFFYNTQTLKMKVENSIKLVIREVKIFWEKADVQTRRDQKYEEKLNGLYAQYRNIQKSQSKASNRPREAEFSTKLNSLFDIAHTDAFKGMNIEKRISLLSKTLFSIASRKFDIESGEDSGNEGGKYTSMPICPFYLNSTNAKIS